MRQMKIAVLRVRNVTSVESPGRKTADATILSDPCIRYFHG